MHRLRWASWTVVAIVVLSAAGILWAQGGPAAPMGESFSLDRFVNDLWRKFQMGGYTMYVILFLSIIGLAFVLERIFRLRRSVIVPAGLAERADGLWREGRRDELQQMVQGRKDTLSKIIRFVLRHRKQPIASVNQAAGDIATRDIERHGMLTYPLAAVAAIAPLLGLFGTVLGMIEAFESVTIAGEMGDPSILSASISKALVTTAFGLFVAIPTLFFYHLFRVRTNFLASLLEEESSTLINDWFMTEGEDA